MFSPCSSRFEAPAVLATAHCGLITLRDEFLGVIAPSKLHAYLAMGLPVIYLGPEGGNVDDAIRRFDCGVSLRHGDVEGMVAFIRRLITESGHFRRLCLHSRRAFDEGYVDVKTLLHFDRVFTDLRERSRLGDSLPPRKR